MKNKASEFNVIKRRGSGKRKKNDQTVEQRGYYVCIDQSSRHENINSIQQHFLVSQARSLHECSLATFSFGLRDNFDQSQCACASRCIASTRNNSIEFALI